MMTLDDIAPDKAELQITSSGPMAGAPEQVRIGYVRAMRKANHGRRIDLSNLFGPQGNPFDDLFKGDK